MVTRAAPPETPVSQPGDASEIEAERVADALIRIVDREPPAIQRGPPTSAQRSCAACAAKERARGRTGVLVHRVTREGGRPLDPATRTFMESRFGRDFGAVRTHTGAEAAASARALDARGYTMGNDIVFGAGQYAPHTQAGQQLLAHELTHVVQQSTGGRASTPAIQRQAAAPTGGPAAAPAATGGSLVETCRAKRDAPVVVQTAVPGRDRIVTMPEGTPVGVRSKTSGRLADGTPTVWFEVMMVGGPEPGTVGRVQKKYLKRCAAFGQGKCGLKASWVKEPKGVIRANMRGKVLAADFDMVADFTPVKLPGIPRCSCRCGEYRQYVRGIHGKFGALDPVVPDQATGCRFEGHDTPATHGTGTPHDKLEIDLQFRADLVNICTGETLYSATWSVVGEGYEP